MKQHVKQHLTNLALLLASTVLSLLAVEVGLRIAGHQPWQYIVHENEPTMHERDETLGWRNKAGKYEFPGYTVKRRRDIKVTFLGDGLRSTHPKQNNRRDDRPKLVIAGGSFTQGWGISDHRTYPWRVQKAFPGFEVLNYGTGGYGTYQTLLTLERALPTLNNPRVVIYGFMAHHQKRNVAPDNWLEMLSRYSNRSHVDLPYVTVGPEGELQRHPPEAYPALPFRDRLAMVHLLGKGIMRNQTKTRKRQARPVTEALLREMNDLSTRHGARFLVVLLEADEGTKEHYKNFLAEHDVPAIDCAFPMGKDMRIRREGHPNGKMNAKWASCLVEQLRQLDVAPRNVELSTPPLPNE